jgi:hypothetical protein
VTIHSARTGLLIFAPAAFLLGIAFVGWAFSDEWMPTSNPLAVSELQVGASVLIVAAASAMIVRWRLPLIRARPTVERVRSAVALSLILLLCGSAFALCLIAALGISDLLVSCQYSISEYGEC